GIFNLGTLTVNDSTIADNVAGHDGGGGLSSRCEIKTAAHHATVCVGGLVTLNNATISANRAAMGGGLDVAGAVQTTLQNTIVAGNAGTTGPDCQGVVTSLGYNLIGVGSECQGVLDGIGGDQVGT